MIAINISVQRSQGSNNATDQRSITVQDETNKEDLAAAFAEATAFLEESTAKYTGKKK